LELLVHDNLLLHIDAVHNLLLEMLQSWLDLKTFLQIEESRVL
jgi:hypothetical protein